MHDRIDIGGWSTMAAIPGRNRLDLASSENPMQMGNTMSDFRRDIPTCRCGFVDSNGLGSGAGLGQGL